MIVKGSLVILRTDKAEYSPCWVHRIDFAPGDGGSGGNVTVKYHKGRKRDKETGEMFDDFGYDTIRRKDIRGMTPLS